MNNILLAGSILLNIVFIVGWAFSPSYQLGRLERNVNCVEFTGDSVLFTLPKGLTVRNISQRAIGAIGQFENERFEIVVTSDDPSLVNYDLPSDELQQFGNMYSSQIGRSND